MLFLDIWAIADILEGWKRVGMKANAVLMLFGVSTFGTLVWCCKNVRVN